LRIFDSINQHLKLKNIPLKISAILMTTLVLFSSSFVLIDQHYCKGKLKSFSVFGNAKECEMDMPICKLENHNISLSKSSCCANVLELKQGSIFKKNLDSNFSIQTSFFNSNNYFNLFEKLVGLTNNRGEYHNYSPPLIFKDVLIFIQCFRI